MSARSELSVSAQVDRHAEAARARASRLILPDFGRSLFANVPHVYPAVICCACQELAVLAERNGPCLARLGVLIGDLRVKLPLTRVLVDDPDLQLAGKARAGSYTAIARGADVVTAELVGTADGLCDGDRRVGGVVDMKGRRTAGRENGSGCSSEPEDVGYVG